MWICNDEHRDTYRGYVFRYLYPRYVSRNLSKSAYLDTYTDTAMLSVGCWIERESVMKARGVSSGGLSLVIDGVSDHSFVISRSGLAK